MTLQTFFTCKECFLDWKNVLFEDCNVQTALSLSLTDGKIHSLNVRRCISSSGSGHDFYFINLDTARNLTFTGTTLFKETQFNKRLVWASWYSSSLRFYTLKTALAKTVL